MKIRNNIARLYQIRDLARINKPIIYVKMIDRLSVENELFLEMYKGIADEVCIEEPMNWSGYEKRKLLENLYNNEQLRLLQLKKQRKACSYPFYTLAINPDGDVVCCCVDWTRSTKVGNIREQTLEEIWNSDSLKRFQVIHLEGNRHLNAACRNCDTLNRCPEADNIDKVSVEQYFTNNK